MFRTLLFMVLSLWQIHFEVICLINVQNSVKQLSTSDQAKRLGSKYCRLLSYTSTIAI